MDLVGRHGNGWRAVHRSLSDPALRRLQPAGIDMITDEEIQILNYIKAYPDRYLAGAEIAKKSNPKLFREEPRWAQASLLRLSDQGLLETDPAGHYRYVDPEAKRAAQVEELKKRTSEF